MPQQLTFPLERREALGRDDFTVSAANAAAMALLDGWANWPGAKALLIGPKGAGKTHLAHVWAMQSGARIMDATQVRADIAPSTGLVVEDVDQIAGDDEAEEHLFHLHNAYSSAQTPLLMTATRSPAHAGFVLPDLQSRLQGALSLSIDTPDDALLVDVLDKQFSDRQIKVPHEVLAFIVTKMERSFDGARRVVEMLDREALLQRRTINKQFAGPLLDKMPDGGA